MDTNLLKGEAHVKAQIVLLGPLISISNLVSSDVCGLHKNLDSGRWECSFIDYSWIVIPINLSLKF